MKTKSFLTMISAIALTVVVSSCGETKNGKSSLPEGQPMGELFLVEKTADDGSAYKVLVDSTGYEVGDRLKNIVDYKDFLSGENLEGQLLLINPKGHTFSHVDSFDVKSIYAVSETPATGKYVKAYIRSGNRVAFALDEIRSLCQVEGLEEDVIPLANGMLLYKQAGLWGIAKNDSDEPIMGAECQEVVVVSVKDKIYYLIKTSDWAGYLDETGKDVKALTPAQFKTAKKAGKLLWSEGSVSARAAQSI